jgi:serine phosphatase RsbU (regulator of sigma subunit)
VPNILEHPLYQSEGMAHGFKAIIGAPLKKGEEVLGVLNVFYDQPHYFTSDELDLLHLLVTQAAVALENARLYEFEVKQVEQELNIARQIQQGFFPKQIPILSGWEIAAICLPARETGGDFYEFVERADDTLGLVVGDVSGKSIPAAMLMAAAQSLVSSKGSDHRSPARVMIETNRLLYKDVPPGAFVAASYALLSAGSDEVCLSNGGQLAPFLVPANGEPIRLIETPGSHLPLGIMADMAYDELSFPLASGDLLIFCTDGLIERKDAAGRLFGFEGALAVLESLAGQSPQAVLDALLEAADAFANGVGPADDVTLVVVRRVSG